MSKNLEERVQDVLSIAREKDYAPGTGWERRMKGALAQVFFLGMSAGWDKHAAAIGSEDVPRGDDLAEMIGELSRDPEARAAYQRALKRVMLSGDQDG